MYKLEKVISAGTIAAAKKKGLAARSVACVYMLYVIGSFLFPIKKGTDVSTRYLNLFVKDKVSWIFALFLKLPRIPKELDSDNYKHYTCRKWGGSVMDRNGGLALQKFREALDNYKVEDVIWDPYKDKRDYAHAFKEITYFYGALASPDHVQPYYLNRDVRHFSQEQGIPTKPRCPEVSNLWILEELRKYNPKYDGLIASLRRSGRNRRENMAKKLEEVLFQPWAKYLLDVYGTNVDVNNSILRVPITILHQNLHRFKDVMKMLKSFLTKDPTFWKSVFSQTLGIPFSPTGEKAYEYLLWAFSFGHQHVEYMHMAHLLSTCYEKIVVFISHTKAYTFLPLFWASKKNNISNEERIQNLLMDTCKYWWFNLGADKHYVRLFPKIDAPMPPVPTIFISHAKTGNFTKVYEKTVDEVF
ncbi:hypothetical protein GIB67_013698 [Kingdonia uniflora]|uniref:Uncharacterized protein n=1 Tax=Kingdonia uniflora TaxID=39325 RepID=A0A7J7NQR7_9MAGN|nr:hypothetical protein GIB67_013698 [Kingdonia uniflora]